jgi:glycosyltransferase involved in cell wall biosynthesis
MEAGISPLVSIIMPTWNRGEFIAETIHSVRAQTYKNWELLIIDDGSEDNTENIVSGIADERIIFHKAGRIAMPGKIKNIGMAKARGEFIAFMDSDDLWAEQKLEKQVGALAKYKDAGFCISGGFNFIKPIEPTEYFHIKTSGEFFGPLFLPFFNSEWTAFAQALLFRKNCLELSGSFRENDNFSDVEFILNLAYHFKGVMLYEPMLYRRVHESGYSSSQWEKGYEQGIIMINEFRDKKMLPEEQAAIALFKLHINFGEKALVQGQGKIAIKQILQAWKQKPYSIVPLKKIAKTVLTMFKPDRRGRD